MELLLGENLLKSPPNLEMAQNHNKAQIIYKDYLRNSERCPCCNLYIETIKYSLSDDINVFSEYGTSQKYFKLVKLNFILLSIIFIIAGMYNLIKNYEGDLCIKSQTCKHSLNNQLSLLNRFDPENQEDDILDALYTIAIIVQVIFIRYITHNINDYYNVDHDYDSEKTIQSCSLQILEINPKWKRDQILNHFKNGMLHQNLVHYSIIDCCLIYDVNHLENQLQLIIREALNQNKDSSLQDILRQIVNQYYIFSIRDQCLKFTGSVYITLSNQQEAINFKNSFKKNFWVKECPRPSDVIWNEKQINLNLKIEIIKCLFAFGGWLPIIAIQVAKNDYILSNPGKTQEEFYINSLLSLVVALIFYISTQICIKLILNISPSMSFNSKREFLKQYFLANENLICIMFYMWPPIFVAVYSGEGNRQERLWRSGGLSEDIIMIILINAGSQIIFTIIDVKYAWKLMKIVYYKYFNQQSNLTQFEANKLFSKEINFNKKRVDLTVLVLLCCYYGYLFPICYPLTLISILIIYWLNKYQLINNAENEKIKFKYRLNRFLLLMFISSQLASTQIIKITFLGYTSNNAFNYIFYAKGFILIYIFFYKQEWIFKKRIENKKTSEDLIQSLQYNDLYSKYNPIINHSIQQLEEQELEGQELYNRLLKSRFSRQEKFYNALQIKLLRKFEQLQKNEIIPISRNRIEPIQNDMV